MGIAQAIRGVTNASGIALSGELPAVHADHRYRVGEPCIELPQLRKYVDAVDSAIRPEVEDEDPPTQLLERERAAARIDPVEHVREARGAHDWS